MHRLLIVLALLITAPAQADIYKCLKNGTTSYQAAPCDHASTASRVVGGKSGAVSAWPWSGLKYGASIEEVKGNIPGVKQEKGSHLYDGAIAMLRKQGVIVAGINFDASYFFKDGKFTQVNLAYQDMTNNEITLRNFEKLSSELRAKFGPEERRNVKNERWGISGKASWLVGSDKLWVSISPITGDTSLLTFGYNPARSRNR